jgi:hypothetical protein
MVDMEVESTTRMYVEYNSNDQFLYHNKLEVMNNRNLKKFKTDHTFVRSEYKQSFNVRLFTISMKSPRLI